MPDGEGMDYVEVRPGEVPPPSEKCPRPEQCSEFAQLRKMAEGHETMQVQCHTCGRLIRFLPSGVR